MIEARLAALQERVGLAARRGPGQAVRLVAVSKHQPVEAIARAHAAGQRDFAENYAQELAAKRTALAHLDLRWHAIGPVQSNKVKLVLGCAWIHTVDRPSLLDELERRAAALAVTQPVLVQVNVAGEPGKSGVAPDEVAALLDRIATLSHVRCDGLMLIPPLADAEATRPRFRALRRLRDELARVTRPNVQLDELSMGMSDDFEVAVEEGATMVRIGTALFGPRTP
ncbi:MAG TPA: YggS family pyridoxal phosphate-dependent enzyme [Nannocystaceae bacterium]|nr:YggS family pyridoxal phosphate-dependent enzyme [Nannocystaceae bacterium]